VTYFSESGIASLDCASTFDRLKSAAAAKAEVAFKKSRRFIRPNVPENVIV
jgi:hypothetical protein